MRHTTGSFDAFSWLRKHGENKYRITATTTKATNWEVIRWSRSNDAAARAPTEASPGNATDSMN